MLSLIHISGEDALLHLDGVLVELERVAVDVGRTRRVGLRVPVGVAHEGELGALGERLDHVGTGRQGGVAVVAVLGLLGLGDRRDLGEGGEVGQGLPALLEVEDDLVALGLDAGERVTEGVLSCLLYTSRCV